MRWFKLVSEKIRILLIKRKMTMSELADKMETTPQNLSNKLSRDNFTEKEMKTMSGALKITNGYLNQNYSHNELKIIREEMNVIIGEPLLIDDSSNKPYSYEEMQDILSTLNEKETIRKNKERMGLL